MQNEKRFEFWKAVGIPPHFFTISDVAFLFNLHEDAVTHLARVDHLEALGDPPPGANKYFSAEYVLALAKDEKWLNKAARLIRENNKLRNSTAKGREA